MKFSVLMSSYYKDDPEELKIALRSIWDEQTVKPAEIVIVKDGPLSAELDAVIDDFSARAPVKIVPLEKNQGLGIALAEGVKQCSCDCIARMDGDDISLPDRFEKQAAFMEQNPDIAICGGMTTEFSENPDVITGKRQLPQTDDEIKKFLKWRSPFNHPTVMFRKQAVLDAGNYRHFLSYEDYWLWARILQNNKGYNLPDTLVNMRAGQDMLYRRKGWRFFIAEIKLAQNLKSINVLNSWQMLRNIFVRATLRLVPVCVLKLVYIKFCRK